MFTTYTLPFYRIHMESDDTFGTFLETPDAVIYTPSGDASFRVQSQSQDSRNGKSKYTYSDMLEGVYGLYNSISISLHDLGIKCDIDHAANIIRKMRDPYMNPKAFLVAYICTDMKKGCFDHTIYKKIMKNNLVDKSNKNLKYLSDYVIFNYFWYIMEHA